MAELGVVERALLRCEEAGDPAACGENRERVAIGALADVGLEKRTLHQPRSEVPFVGWLEHELDDLFQFDPGARVGDAIRGVQLPVGQVPSRILAGRHAVGTDVEER